MKKIYLIIISFAFIANVMSQTPESFKYQAVLRDETGNVKSNETVEIEILILSGSETGTAIYTETHNAVTNNFGLINLNIGEGTTSDDFSSIDWGISTYFIKISIDGTEFGTSQILSVPYALYAKKAENVFSGNFIDLMGIPANLDIDSTDDFDGNYSSLTGAPINISTFFNDAGYITYSNDTSTVNELQNLENVLQQGNSAGNNTIINLADPINKQDAATRAYVDAFGTELIINIHTIIAGGKVTDIKGNEYNTVKIGDQVWMAENLRTTAYYDGTAIPLETDNNEWYNLTTPAYCWYYNDSATYSAEYGVLYNWYAVITDNICPIGWHVSTHSEWVTMINYLGGISVAGAKLKEKGTTHWNNPNTGATNESGFNGLPAGRRDPEFCTLGDFGNFWTSTQTSATHAWGHSLVNNAIYVCGGGYEKMNGYSVRCVKD